MYHGLSGEGAIRKRFFSHRTVHRGRFLFEKRFEEVAFSSEVALKRTASTAERQLTVQKAVQKTTKLTQRTYVAERTILIRRMVVGSTVLIGRAMVERAVSIREGRWWKGRFKNWHTFYRYIKEMNSSK